MDDYMTKPVNQENLENVLIKWLTVMSVQDQFRKMKRSHQQLKYAPSVQNY